MDNKELYHWGIKGMKWGRRRYQNKDGSLTPAGRKRYGDDDFTPSSDDQTPVKPKTSKEMTNDELSDAIKNLELQKRYNQLYNEMNPQTVSKGKEIATKLLDNAIIPAVTEAGKSLLKDTLLKIGKQSFGLDGDAALSAYDKLKKEADVERLKQQISSAKRKQYEDDTWLNKKLNEDAGQKKVDKKAKRDDIKEREEIHKRAKEAAKSSEKLMKDEIKQAKKEIKQESRERRERFKENLKDVGRAEKSNEDLIREASATIKEVKAQRGDVVNTSITDPSAKQVMADGKKLLDRLLEDY